LIYHLKILINFLRRIYSCLKTVVFYILYTYFSNILDMVKDSAIGQWLLMFLVSPILRKGKITHFLKLLGMYQEKMLN